MKKLALTLIAVLGILSASKAQTIPQRKLAPKLKFEVTDVQYIALVNKLDSAVMLLQNSDLPSNQLRDFRNRVGVALYPFTKQLQSQLVLVDSVKAAPVAKKGGKQ